MKLFSKSENAEHVIAFYKTLATGDLSAACRMLDPDIEWKEPNEPALWFRGIHYGADAVLEKVFEPMLARVAGFRMKMRKVFVVGNAVVAVGRFQGRVRRTGRELDIATMHHWTFHHGLAVRLQAVYDLGKWVELARSPALTTQHLEA